MTFSSALTGPQRGRKGHHQRLKDPEDYSVAALGHILPDWRTRFRLGRSARRISCSLNTARVAAFVHVSAGFLKGTRPCHSRTLCGRPSTFPCMVVRPLVAVAGDTAYRGAHNNIHPESDSNCIQKNPVMPRLDPLR